MRGSLLGKSLSEEPTERKRITVHDVIKRSIVTSTILLLTL